MIRLAILATVLLLASCAEPEPPPAEPVPVPAPEAAAPAPAPATNPVPAAKAVREYKRAEAAEAHAVTKPGATADSITAIHRANALARKAVADLVAQDGHPTPAAIARARRTLDDLIRTLEAPPQ
jgi:hypothetical protein